MNDIKVIKTCLNCAYKSGGTCLRSGYSWDSTREYALHSNNHCDTNFSGWELSIEKPLKKPLKKRWYKRLLKL